MKRKDKGGEEYKSKEYKDKGEREGEEYNIVYEINDISKKKIRGGRVELYKYVRNNIVIMLMK